MSDDKKSEIAKTALARYKQAEEAWKPQRDREDKALRFQVPEMQWDDDVRRARLGQDGGAATPGRPVLSIPKLDQPISLVIGQMRSAHLGVEIHPVSEDAEDDTAEVLQDKYREIERDSNANLARAWAFERAVKAGMGFYFVGTEKDQYSSDKSDQKVVIKRIMDARSVLLDPDAQKADFSDGSFAFMRAALRSSTFKDRYPKADVPVSDKFAFADAMSAAPGWLEGDSSDPVVIVADYWWKVYEDGDSDTWTLMYAKLAPGGDPLQFLDGPREVNGCLIPIVMVPGRELTPFEKKAERRYQGMIEPAMDAQRLFNYSASSAVELAALEPKAPWVATPKQIQGFEQMYQASNVSNIPVLYYNVDTGAAGAPVRTQVDVGRLGPSMQLLQEADSFIQAATATYNPSLGRTTDSHESGKKVQALQDQATAATSIYLQNLADIAMNLEAQIVLEQLFATHDRPGRVIRTLSVEGDSSAKMLNAPYYNHPETGKPTAIPNGGVVPPNVKVQRHDFTRGKYGVSITVGKAYQTKIAQASQAITDLMGALPPQVQVAILPAWLKVQDFPGHTELAETMGKIRDHEMPFLTAGEDGQTDPKQMQAQMQTMGQQLQDAQSKLQQAAQIINTEQIKTQAQIQTKQIDLQIARENNATKIAVARLAQKGALVSDAMEAQEEAIALRTKLTHEATQAAHDRGHEAGMAAMAATHAQDAAAQQGAQDQAAQAQAGAQDQQAQAADQQHEAGMQASDQAAAAQSQSAQQEHEAEQAAAAAAQPQEGA